MEEVKRFTVAVPKSVHSWLKGRARVNTRSMSGEVLEIVKQEKEKEEKATKKK